MKSFMPSSTDAYGEAVTFLDELAQCPDQRERAQTVMRYFSKLRAATSVSNAQFKARNSTEATAIAPDYVDGPNGFCVQCYDAWGAAKSLNALFALRPAPPTTKPSSDARAVVDQCLEICYGEPSLMDAITKLGKYRDRLSSSKEPK